MTKKIVAVLLAFGLTFSLMACGSSAGAQTGASGGTGEAQEEPAEETDVQEAQDEAQPESEGQETAGDVAEAVEDGAQGADLTGKKVGFSALMMSSEFFTDMSNQMEAYFTEHGMEYSVADANGNAQTQIQTVENFVSMGMDYIICFVVDASSISDSLIKAREGGAFIIVIGTVLDNKDAYDVCISISQNESGITEAKMAAEWIDATFPDAEDGSIEVGLLTNSENEDAVARCDGLREIVNFTSKAVIVEEHETTQAEGAAAGQTYAEMMLMNNPDLKVILTYGTDQGQGANEAVMKDSSINSEEFAVFTVDTAEFIRNKVKESANGTSVLRGTVMLGEGTPMTCYNLMDGTWSGRVEDKVYSEECIMITPETISEYFPE
ncbi:MAG: substrate-binding domain-containing protein [Lachnospiraceae bacterium]|nr:substrate-binding domain-containing protein [Lachnospiraceae bacterium]